MLLFNAFMGRLPLSDDRKLKERTTVRFREQTYKQLRELAESRGITVASLVQLIVTDYLSAQGRPMAAEPPSDAFGDALDQLVRQYRQQYGKVSVERKYTKAPEED